MGIFDGLLGGGGSELDIYGDLFSKEQKAALAQRSAGEGLLKLAGAFGQAAQPSRLPTSFMGALGQAAGAMAGGTGEETALKGMEIAEKVRQARAERAILAKTAPLVEAITARLIGAGVPAAQATQIAAQVAGGQTTSASAADAPVPPGAGGGGPNAPPPPPGAPPLNALGMPQPRNNAAFGIPPRPGQPPLTPTEAAGTQSLSPPPPGQQNTGLLPRQDQVVGPDGQPLTGPGVLPNIMNASLAGGMPGGGLPFRRASSSAAPTAPGGDEWLRQNAPFSTQGGAKSPGAYAQGFTYDQPKVPFGQDPGDFLPGRRPSVGAPSNLTGPASNNLGNIRRPGVIAGPSQGGFQQFDTPQAGVAAISKQLDRYASGATTGTPLTTVRDIVSTWAPPNENPTAALIARAAKTLGVDPDAPLDVSNPAVKAKLIEATIRNEHGGKLPIDQQTIERVAAMQPDNRDFVISSGRGVPASALRNVADTGGGAPGVPASGGGFLPGTDVRPEELAALNAMLKMGGIKSDPFGSLLDTYYKSPGYLAEKARTETKARTDVEDPINRRMKMLDFHLKMRGDGFLIDDNGQVVEDPAHAAITGRRAERTEELKLKYEKQKKLFDEQITIDQEQRADQRQVVTTPVYGPDGRIVQQEMLLSDKLKQLRNQTMRPGEYKPGDIVSKPIGDPPAGHEWRMTPRGELRAEPVAGTPAATEAATAAQKKELADRQLLVARDIVVQNADMIEQQMQGSVLPTTGFIGSRLAKVEGTAAHNIAALIETMEARASLDQLTQLRAASPTGAGLGAPSDRDAAILRTSIANLKQSQNDAQFLINLRRMKEAYVDAVHGPGASKALPSTPIINPPNPAPAGSAASPGAAAVPPGAVPTGQYYQGKPVYRTPDGKTGTLD